MVRLSLRAGLLAARIVLPVASACLVFATGMAAAETLTLKPAMITEWKAVHGRIEADDMVAARARIGGTLIELTVTEGDVVAAGQKIGVVTDEKIAFQAQAIDAQLSALAAQKANAEAELARGRELVRGGVSTNQRVEQLQTQVDVIAGQIAAAQAQRAVIVRQGEEGAIIAPAAGRVTAVPLTPGSVVLPGEPVAMIASGALSLRLALPERHAALLKQGATLPVETPEGETQGRLAKLYPLIENGRVLADVTLEGMDAAYLNQRVLVRVPVGERAALMVPPTAVTTRNGLDFVALARGDATIQRNVVIGARAGGEVEILTGLQPGDVILLDPAAPQGANP
ncbi:MAG: efflux RND transporter periplasmic adaptor subunit [Rhizobiaceae bacterium]|jgi:RND family efflux transporter MFP subunit|nr:efflux RND transporter periplasmic adaptor subunit [Rhizobiaceae bacterium]